MWILYGLLAGITAALMTIAAKIGLKTVDPTFATAIRSVFMAGYMLLVVSATGKWTHLSSLDARGWRWIALAAALGAASWLFYFLGLQAGTATRLAALDRLSLPLIVLLSFVLLHEVPTTKGIIGAVITTFGILLMTIK